MMPQPLPALHQTEVAYHAIMSAAHLREPRIPEPTHDTSMHWHARVSNLDAPRINALSREASLYRPALFRRIEQSAGWLEHERNHAASSRSANALSICLRTAAVGCPCRCKRRSLFHSLMISRSRSASIVANLRDINDRTNKEQTPEILDVAAPELRDTAGIDPYEDGQGNPSAGADRGTRGVHDQ
jgi:hypothetical protein